MVQIYLEDVLLKRYLVKCGIYLEDISVEIGKDLIEIYLLLYLLKSLKAFSKLKNHV